MTRKEVAEYVAEIASVLARIAQGVRLHDLAYLLGMAAQEATNAVAGETEVETPP